jgi:hypothetical protein
VSASAAVLCGQEGELVSVSISVDPRHLESLLEALAELEFPINPQIYHDAALVYRYADGHEERESTTLVEFPAYEGRLGDVRRAVEAFGFDADSVHVTGMLDEIHAGGIEEVAPAGAAYVARVRVKRSAIAIGS